MYADPIRNDATNAFRTAASLGAAETRQPEISNQLDRLAKTIEFAEYAFNELQARCAPIARGEASSTETNKALPREVMHTPVANLILLAGDRVQNLGDRMQDLARRFEV